MKPVSFDYVAPATLDEAIACLAEAPADTRVLAGGQSLMSQLNLRDVRPERIVDLNRVAELASVARDGDRMRIGAMTRLRTLVSDAAIAEALPLVAEAARHVGHPAVRSRSTVGGCVAQADPAGELAVALVALGATVVLRSAGGEREVAAREFFLGSFATVARPDEIVVAVEVPVTSAGTATAFTEAAHPGGRGLVVAAAVIALDGEGRTTAARLALGGVASTPLALDGAVASLLGERPEAERVAALAAEIAAALDPPRDPAHRRAVAAKLVERSLTTAIERAGRTA